MNRATFAKLLAVAPLAAAVPLPALEAEVLVPTPGTVYALNDSFLGEYVTDYIFQTNKFFVYMRGPA